MKARVQKWGNSLAIRIPRPLAEDVRISAGSEVELTEEGGRLIIATSAHWSERLDDLLRRFPPGDGHPETDWGPPVGDESW